MDLADPVQHPCVVAGARPAVDFRAVAGGQDGHLVEGHVAHVLRANWPLVRPEGEPFAELDRRRDMIEAERDDAHGRRARR